MKNVDRRPRAGSFLIFLATKNGLSLIRLCATAHCTWQLPWQLPGTVIMSIKAHPVSFLQFRSYAKQLPAISRWWLFIKAQSACNGAFPSNSYPIGNSLQKASKSKAGTAASPASQFQSRSQADSPPCGQVRLKFHKPSRQHFQEILEDLTTLWDISIDAVRYECGASFSVIMDAIALTIICHPFFSATSSK